MVLDTFRTADDIAGMAMGAEIDIVAAVKDTMNTVSDFTLGKCPG
jgi:hypothetical protein